MVFKTFERPVDYSVIVQDLHFKLAWKVNEESRLLIGRGCFFILYVFLETNCVFILQARHANRFISDTPVHQRVK